MIFQRDRNIINLKNHFTRSQYKWYVSHYNTDSENELDLSDVVTLNITTIGTISFVLLQTS